MRLLFILFLSLGVYQTNGQHVLIQGKVSDEYGNPISYASIIGKKTRSGVTTDSKGRYSIVLDRGLDDTIICSHVSYLQKKESIGKNKTINFLLVRKPPETFFARIPISDTTKLSETNIEQRPLQGFFVKVEVGADFPGGLIGFVKEFKQKFSLSDSSKAKLFEGEIKLQFTVTSDGSVKNILLLKGIDPIFDDTIIQTIMKMRRWTPAIQNGRNVEDFKEISILFTK